jgi:K+/H+ antiporter YhaU regulatory subunit KhtT
MKIPLEKLIEDYITTMETNSKWITEEVKSLNPKTDPTMQRVAEILGRGSNSMRQMAKMRELVTGLEELCKILDIDIETVTVEKEDDFSY